MTAQPVPLPLVTAADFMARLGPAALPAIGMTPGNLHHVPGAFDTAWIEAAPLPLAASKAPEQTVALVDGTEFRRDTGLGALANAYQERARTRVYESLDVRSDGWFSLVSLHLAGILRRRVICTAYESQAGDRNLGAHDDHWLGVIVQMRGAKQWQIWTSADSRPVDLLTSAGDVLVLPRGMTHAVSTPEYSAHLVFAVTDQPMHARPGPERELPPTRTDFTTEGSS
ncbi:cupin domain-containing protein [Streptomyces prunicolor]|uniref:cupin domain-containing protein n=1 Tax=Streptomyces prunicolor TaxID=67348 RepID=UPI0003622BFD|nr:cupin domain-containing protein [Streptomyces prunicolor]